MRMVLMLLPLMWATATLAAPPALHTDYTFVDPVFSDVVVCDTAQQVRIIATAPDPNLAYKTYYGMPNERGFPTCVAAPFEANVVSVEQVGLMDFHGYTFAAWIVGVSGKTNKVAYALYLEKAILS